MDSEIVNSLMSRMDRLEATNAYSYTPPDRGDEIAALRKELSMLKADVQNRELEIRDLRSLVAAKVDASAARAIFDKGLAPHISTVGDFVADAVIGAEKTLRTEIGDATRTLARTVEQAEAAAAANVKSASAIIAAWASELGA